MQCAFAFLTLFAWNIWAKVPEATPSEIFAKAQVVALGRVSSDEQQGLKFDLAEVFKGPFMVGTELPLCASSDLEGAQFSVGQEAIVFLRTAGTCYETVLGYRGYVRTSDDDVLTGSLRGQPERTPRAAFLSAMRQLARVKR